MDIIFEWDEQKNASNKVNMLVVCHCYRDNEQKIRVISARKATKTECSYY